MSESKSQKPPANHGKLKEQGDATSSLFLWLVKPEKIKPAIGKQWTSGHSADPWQEWKFIDFSKSNVTASTFERRKCFDSALL